MTKYRRLGQSRRMSGTGARSTRRSTRSGPRKVGLLAAVFYLVIAILQLGGRATK